MKKNPLTSTRKGPKLLVESLTLRYNTMGNSPRCLSQKFFAAEWQTWDLWSYKEGPRHTLYKQFLTYFQKISLVEPGFLHKWSNLPWIAVYWKFTIDLYVEIWILQILVLPNLYFENMYVIIWIKNK